MNPDPIRLPNLDDPDLAPFWRGIARGELLAQRCEDCGTMRFPPLPVCDNCLSERTEWVPVSQNGTIWSYVRYFRAFHPAFADDVPYVVALVENEDGLMFVGNIEGPSSAIAVGAAVSAVFAPVTRDLSILKWRVE
jgi:uncharacterized OB-fold protein